MAATVSKDDVLNRLEIRYDYQSSRNVLNNWRKAVGLKEEAPSFSVDDVNSLADYLEALAEDTNEVADSIRRLVVVEEKAPEKEEPKKEVPEVKEEPEKKEDKKGKKKKKK